MTDRETDPSHLPDTPLPSQDNTTTDAGASAETEPTPAMAAPAAATGVAGAEEPYPFTEGIEDGKPRTQVVVRPRPDLRTDAPDESAPNGAGAVARARLDAPTNADHKTTSARSWAMGEVGPIDRLVEFALPTRTFTDWLLVDPLRRGELFKQAIAKDPAGVDAASARARAVGYTAGGFADALKAVVAGEIPFKLTSERLAVGMFGQERERPALYPGRSAAIAESGRERGDSAGRPGSDRRFAQLAFPPTLLFARPPIVPRPLRPLEELPKGEAGGPNAGRRHPRSLRYPDGTPCTYCGQPTWWSRKPKPDRQHRDHVIPKNRGGTNGPENTTPACQACNLQKNDKTPAEWHHWSAGGGGV
jgi:hypothetical protein